MRAPTIFAILALCLLLAGCWDYSEIKDKTIVAGISLDLTENGRIRAGFELLPLPAGVDESVKPAVLFTEGDTVEQAIYALTEKISYAPYVSHSWLVAVSEEYASQGIQPLVDLICVNPDFYMGTYIAVVKGGEAGDILSCESISAPILSFEIIGSFEADARYVSKTNAVYTYELFSNMDSAGFVLPAIEIIETEGKGKSGASSGSSGASSGDGGGEGEGDNAVKVVANAGGAVFAGGSLQFYLTPDEVLAYRMFTGQLETIVLTPDRSDLQAQGTSGLGEITYSITDSSAKLHIDVSGELPRCKLTVGLSASTKAMPGADDMELRRQLGKQKAERILNEILQKAKATGCDFIGLRQQLYMRHPGTYRELEDRWDELYPNIQCEIEVQFEVTD